MGVEGLQGERSRGGGGGQGAKAPGRAVGLPITPDRRVSQPGPPPPSPPAVAPGEAGWAPSGSLAGPGGGGLGARRGGALCACVSGPYLFSPLLILVPPAAPHTKPHSPNPQGAGRGASFTQLPCSGPRSPALQLHEPALLALVPPSLRRPLPEVGPGKSSGLLSFPSPLLSTALSLPRGSWWWTRPGSCPWALRGRR